MKAVEFVKNWWKNASSVSRALVATGALTVIAGVSYTINAVSTVDQAPLYRGLNPEDAAEVVEKLKADKIPYTLEETAKGTRILIPKSKRTEVRLEMAKAGLPNGGHEGFSLFDDSSVLMTDFTQKVNLQRALQGELARTISTFPQVETARVHIATPERSIFSAHQKDPSASVVVHLKRGKKLSEEQISTINHLVASAVENLSPDRITITDQRMRLLGSPGNDTSKSAKMLGLVHDQEKRLEGRVINLLEPAVGMGRVVARVSVDMDLSKVKETQEEYDPDNATLKSERKLSENAKEQNTKDPGVAGVAGNIPQRQGGAGVKTNIEKNSGRDETIKEYAIPNVVRHTERAIGKMRRLSVAVLIDSSPFESDVKELPTEKGDKKDEKTIKVPNGVEGATQAKLPPKPDLGRLSELVKTAVGFDAKRGDQIELLFVPFNKTDVAQITPVQETAFPTWVPMSVATLLGFVMLAAAVFITERKRRKREEAEAAQREEQEALAAEELASDSVAEQKMKSLEEEMEDLDPVERQARLRDEVKRLSQERQEITFTLFKNWLEEGMPTTGES